MSNLYKKIKNPPKCSVSGNIKNYDYNFYKIDDPAKFYHWPIVGKLYKNRIEYCLDQCSGGDKVLEVGFGSGICFPQLSEKYDTIYGLDLNCDCQRVEQLYAETAINTELVNGSVVDMPYDDNFFDTVLCISILEHLKADELQLAVSEIFRVLKPGGRFVYGAPVESAAMVAAFRLLGYNIRDYHFSTEKDIADAVASIFGSGEVMQMSSFFSFNRTIYEIGDFQK